MRLTVGLEFDPATPNGALLARFDLRPPYATPVEERAVLTFIARLVLAELAEGHARVLEFSMRNGGERS